MTLSTTRRRGSPRLLALCIFFAVIPSARAGGTTLAEPIVEENITDIDALETGTLELDVTGALVRGRGGRGGGWTGGFEAEVRPLDRFGLGGELSTSGPASGFAPESPAVTTTRGAASYVFLRDMERRLFLQGEATARYDAGPTDGLDVVTEPELPYTFGLRWAAELGPLTLRAGAVGEAGGTSAHAPLRTSAAALFQVTGSRSRFCVGGEATADGARAAPLLFVPEALLLTRPFGKPVRLGIGAPIGVHPRLGDGAFGFVFRLVFEPDE